MDEYDYLEAAARAIPTFEEDEYDELADTIAIALIGAAVVGVGVAINYFGG